VWKTRSGAAACARVEAAVRAGKRQDLIAHGLQAARMNATDCVVRGVLDGVGVRVLNLDRRHAARAEGSRFEVVLAVGCRLETERDGMIHGVGVGAHERSVLLGVLQ